MKYRKHLIGAMLVLPGFRALVRMVKNPPAKQAWKSIPCNKYKDAAELIIGLL